jgi:hypothetical protein
VPARSRRLRGTGKQRTRQHRFSVQFPERGWQERLFATHAAQICFEWNTAVHAVEYEGEACRRALGLAERLTSSIQTCWPFIIAVALRRAGPRPAAHA